MLETRHVILSLNQRQDDQERNDILFWLSSIDLSVQQSEAFQAHQEGTGTWLLGTMDFYKWINEEEERLYCPGIPGAGKTVLSPVVTNHLEQTFANQNYNWNHIYLSHTSFATIGNSKALLNSFRPFSSCPFGGSLHYRMALFQCTGNT